MNPVDFDLIFDGDRALDKMLEAAHEYEVEFGDWCLEGFNRWLIERYGVEHIAGHSWQLRPLPLPSSRTSPLCVFLAEIALKLRTIWMI